MVIASGMGFNTSTFTDISVLDDALFSERKRFASTNTPEKIEKLNIERLELPDLTSFYLFHFTSSDFHTITLTSGNTTLVYRGFSTIAIKSNALASLNPQTPLSVTIISEKSSTSFSHDTYTVPVTIFSKQMILSPGYQEEKNENITTREENGELIITGLVSKGKNIKNEIMLTLPNGDVEKYTFGAESIDTDRYLKRGRVFTKTIPLSQIGTYLVEVNYDNGFAAYNGPIIYGDVLPLAPNNTDGLQKTIGSNDSSIVAEESLAFVNALRVKSGKSTLMLDDTLTLLANIKANDMAQHANLSHTDSYGDKISGTAKRNNIPFTGNIGENIA